MTADRVQPGGTKQMQVRELIDLVIAFHAGASKIYSDEQARTKDEETNMLLSHLARHEHGIVERLTEYRDHAPAAVSETWIKYVPDISVQTLLEKLDSLPNSTLEETTELAATLSDSIVQIYVAVAEASAAEHVHDAIADLMDAERRDKVRATRSAEKL